MTKRLQKPQRAVRNTKFTGKIKSYSFKSEVSKINTPHTRAEFYKYSWNSKKELKTLPEWNQGTAEQKPPPSNENPQSSQN